MRKAFRIIGCLYSLCVEKQTGLWFCFWRYIEWAGYCIGEYALVHIAYAAERRIG